MARGYSTEQWAEWIGEQERSRLTVYEFCEAIGVSKGSFYRWRARLGDTVADTLPAAGAGEAESSGESFFVPLSVVGVPGVEVELPGGAVVRVPREEALLRSVLRILMEADEARRGASS